MTEYEKSQLGLPHVFDKPMHDMYNRAALLCSKYNQTSDVTFLDELIPNKGKDIRIMPSFHCEFGHNIVIGDHVFINFNGVILDNSKVTIGNHTLIGPNVSIYTVNHAIDIEDREKGICMNKPVSIGNNVWLGGDVNILPGITIGDGSIIGTGSVVTKNIPAGVIAAGNPCKVIRKINKDDKL